MDRTFLRPARRWDRLRSIHCHAADRVTAGAKKGKPMPLVETILDVPGISVGQFTDRANLTGCTVVLCPDGATAAVDVRGGAPGTREVELLGLGRLVQQVQAVLLAGGSAFGLAAADGVMQYLAERGYGYSVGSVRVPVVPAAILFDLGLGSDHAYPDAAAGYAAASAARSDRLEQGCVGAGTGATVGKVLGIGQATKGGIGSAALRLSNGITVAALVAVNALGDVVHPVTGQILAGARDPSTGEYVGSVGAMIRGDRAGSPPAGNTTIGVVATDARLSRDEASRLATLAHDGLARTVRPAHTLYDGDTFFALATGRARETADPVRLAVAASEVVATAIVHAVMAATPLGGLPAAGGRVDPGAGGPARTP
jgi:L-aminopeptidase/D-esterase-like protein